MPASKRQQPPAAADIAVHERLLSRLSVNLAAIAKIVPAGGYLSVKDRQALTTLKMNVEQLGAALGELIARSPVAPV